MANIAGMASMGGMARMDSPTRIEFIRHAESVYNRTPTLVGGRSDGVALTAEGYRAAQEAGERRRRLPAPAALYSSGAVRADATAQALADGAGWQLPVQHEPRLLELSQGQAESQARATWWTPDALAAMRLAPATHRLAPDAENHLDVQERMIAAIRDIATAYPGRFVVAIGHGIAIRTLAWRLAGGGHVTFQRWPLPNLGSLTITALPDGPITFAT